MREIQQQTTKERGDCTQRYWAGKWNSPYTNNARHRYANHSTCHMSVATLLIIGLSSSLSIGSEVLCTQQFVQRWRRRTN